MSFFERRRGSTRRTCFTDRLQPSASVAALGQHRPSLLHQVARTISTCFSLDVTPDSVRMRFMRWMYHEAMKERGPRRGSSSRRGLMGPHHMDHQKWLPLLLG
jgi:hypothetical protein